MQRAILGAATGTAQQGQCPPFHILAHGVRTMSATTKRAAPKGTPRPFKLKKAIRRLLKLQLALIEADSGVQADSPNATMYDDALTSVNTALVRLKELQRRIAK